MRREQAEHAAAVHRDRYGDDVVLHCPGDEGWALICDDCGWLAILDPDDDDP